MNTHKLAITIGGILGLILIIGGIFAINHNQQISKKQKTQSVELPPPPEYLEQKVEPVGEMRPISEWEKLSDQEIATIAGKELTEFCYTEMPLGFSEEIDLIGDNKQEALFGCGAGNGTAYALFINDGNKTSIAQVKPKDGVVMPVTFFSKATAYEVGFKLLPKEHAYYDYSKFYNDDTKQYDCSARAYQWNSETKQFEWNESLSEKYTDQFVKDRCQL